MDGDVTRFGTGVIDWPADVAMDRLVAYDPAATRRGLLRIAETGM